MSENTNEADALLAQGQSVVSAKAEDVIAGISSVKEVDLLKAALIAEQAGKARVTVISALEDAIKAAEAPDGAVQPGQESPVPNAPPASGVVLPVDDNLAAKDPATTGDKLSFDPNADRGEGNEGEIDTSGHVEMVRDEPQFEGGPTSALVHPDEVSNYAEGGWTEA